MFKYEFMQVAFIIGILLSIAIPLIGNTVVFKRLSMTGDALSHTALAGVTIGLILGVNPIFVTIFTTIIAGLIIEFIRKKFHKYSEISIAIVLSGGIGLAGVLSSFTPVSNFNAYLFGSIVAITQAEFILTIIVAIIVILASIFFYRHIMFICYNEENAKLAGVPVLFLNTLFTTLTALTVAIASKTIGALIVSSLMVVPVATALQISKNYKSTIIYSVIFAFISVVVGLTLSFYEGLKPGATIVMTSIVILIIVMSTKSLANKLGSKIKK